jgi:hypothetical protein
MSLAPGTPAHAVLCVVAPLAVGAIMYLLFDVWDAQRQKRQPGTGLPFVDYSI